MDYTEYALNYHDIYFYFSKFYSDENTNTPKGKYWKDYYKQFNCDFLITAIDGSDDNSIISTSQYHLGNRNSISFLASEYINPSFAYFSPTKFNTNAFNPREKGFEYIIDSISSCGLVESNMIACKKYLRRIIFSMLANKEFWDDIFKIGRPYTQLLFRIDFMKYYSGKPRSIVNKMLFDDFIFAESHNEKNKKRGLFVESIIAKDPNETISEFTFVDSSDLKFSFTDIHPFKPSMVISQRNFYKILSSRITNVIKNSSYTKYFLSVFSSSIERNKQISFPNKKRFIGFDNYFFDYEKIMNNCEEAYVRL